MRVNWGRLLDHSPELNETSILSSGADQQGIGIFVIHPLKSSYSQVGNVSTGTATQEETWQRLAGQCECVQTFFDRYTIAVNHCGRRHLAVTICHGNK